MSMAEIQAELKAPKGQFNSFGKYKYRSCEDIIEAAKPILTRRGYHLNMYDEVVAVLDRVYVKATCRVMNGSEVVAEATAYAREALDKKGQDDSQITGTASSYARKYALNGLLAIDDTKDADTDEHTLAQAKPPARPAPTKELIDQFSNCQSMAELKSLWESLSVAERESCLRMKNDTKARLAA
jgi:hypothetical protein